MAIHKEVLFNLSTELGIQLRVNRSIRAEGTFGTIRENRGYDRFRRRGMERTHLEFGLVAMGFNLYKHRNRIVCAKAEEKRATRRKRKAAA